MLLVELANDSNQSLYMINGIFNHVSIPLFLQKEFLEMLTKSSVDILIHWPQQFRGTRCLQPLILMISTILRRY